MLPGHRCKSKLPTSEPPPVPSGAFRFGWLFVINVAWMNHTTESSYRKIIQLSDISQIMFGNSFWNTATGYPSLLSISCGFLQGALKAFVTSTTLWSIALRFRKDLQNFLQPTETALPNDDSNNVPPSRQLILERVSLVKFPCQSLCNFRNKIIEPVACRIIGRHNGEQLPSVPVFFVIFGFHFWGKGLQHYRSQMAPPCSGRSM